MASQAILEKKRAQVDEIKNKIQNAKGLVIIDYVGLNVMQDTLMRKKLRERGIDYSVLKNRLVKMAFNELGHSEFDEALNGPSAFAFSETDTVEVAKAIAECATEYKKIQIKCGYAEGSFIDANEVKQLAKLPPKEVLLAQMLGSMQSPITNLAYCLNGLISGLAICINQIAEKRA